jgi:hypothetical protein
MQGISAIYILIKSDANLIKMWMVSMMANGTQITD